VSSGDPILNFDISDPDLGDDILDAYNSTPKAKVRIYVVIIVLLKWNVLMMYHRHIVCAQRGVERN
jgi:hypothetical protein